MKRQYEYKNDKFLKNGHTMFSQDVLQDLKRLADLEYKIANGQMIIKE